MEIIIETMEQAHKFFGSRKSITKLSPRGLLAIKEEAKADLGLINVRRHEEYSAAQKMQANGSLQCRKAIMDKVDQLLKTKNYPKKESTESLGVNRPA